MNSDFRDLLRALHECEVRHLVVGGYAVIHHSQPRFTKDLDLWIEPSPENARRLMRAFAAFGVPLIGVTESDFAVPGTQFCLGVPPCQIDFLTTVPGLEFASSWERKVVSMERDLPIPYLGRDDLILAKQTAGRHQDMADVEELRRAAEE